MSDRILCTFPGRHGDLLWALPAIRAISEEAGHPVDLQIAGEFGGILPILEGLPYLEVVWADPRWGLTPPEEWVAPPAWPPRTPGGPLESYPPEPPATAPLYDRVYHLGYRGWPNRPLPEETYLQAVIQVGHTLPPLELDRPWLVAPATGPIDWSAHPGVQRIAVGFTECYFELKVGLLQLLREHNWRWDVHTVMGGGRWHEEAGEGAYSWAEAAHAIAGAEVVLADCSALHVLAVGLGIPVVIMEPMEARWNRIFYPCGMNGPEVWMVCGHDLQPTFDARHTIQAIEARLRGR